jgi:iron(III) transport system substrate-binding protein
VNQIVLKLRLVVLLAGINICVAAPAYAQTRDVGELFALQGNNRLQTLVDGARKEGELSIYLAHPSIPLVAAAFTKKYGIKVNTWRAGSESVLQRTVTQAQGKRHDVDLVENNAPEMEALHREKLLQELKSPYMSDLMPQAIPAHKEWVGVSIDIFTLGYNTRKVKKEDLPKTWQDLLDPRWKGQLGAEAEDQVWFAYVVRSLGEDAGVKLFKDIAAANGVSFRKGHSLLGQLVSSGEIPLGLNLYSWGADQMKEKGAPIERFFIGQPIAHFQGIAVLKKAPHPHAAVLFLDFMLNEGQEIMSKTHAVATSNKYDQVQKSVPITFIDPVTAMDVNQKWVKVYQEIFMSKTK